MRPTIICGRGRLLAGLLGQPVEEVADWRRVLLRVLLDLLVDDEGHWAAEATAWRRG